MTGMKKTIKVKLFLSLFAILMIVGIIMSSIFFIRLQESRKKLKETNYTLNENLLELEKKNIELASLQNNLESSKDTLNKLRDSLTIYLKEVKKKIYKEKDNEKFRANLERLILKSESIGLEELIKTYEISIIYQGGQNDNARIINEGLKAKGYTKTIRKPVEEISNTYSIYAIVTSNEFDERLAPIIKNDLDKLLPNISFSIFESIYNDDLTPNSISIMLRKE